MAKARKLTPQANGSTVIVWRDWRLALVIGLPIVLTVFYLFSVSTFIAGVDWTKLRGVWLNDNIVDQFARDAGGRIQFGTVVTLLRIAAAAAIVLAFFVFLRRTDVKTAVRLAVVTMAFCIGVCLIMLRLDGPAAQAGLIRGAIDAINFTADARGHFLMAPVDIDRALRLNILVSIIGGGHLLAAYAAVALRVQPDDLTADKLLTRMRDLERITVLCAIFLVVLTAVNKTLNDWPQAMLTESHQKAYSYLAGSIANFWGTCGALFLISALGSAYLCLRLDIDLAARKGASGGEADWTKKNGLEFGLTSGLGAALAAAAPILTAPGIDLAGKLLH